MCSGDSPRDRARSAQQPPGTQEQAHTSPQAAFADCSPTTWCYGVLLGSQLRWHRVFSCYCA